MAYSQFTQNIGGGFSSGNVPDFTFPDTDLVTLRCAVKLAPADLPTPPNYRNARFLFSYMTDRGFDRCTTKALSLVFVSGLSSAEDLKDNFEIKGLRVEPESGLSFFSILGGATSMTVTPFTFTIEAVPYFIG